MLEGQAGSLGQLFEEVDRICRLFKTDFNAREEIWFRGQSRAHWNLQPDLYREGVASYHYNEVALVDRFMALATPLLGSRPASDWEW
jgi:hypothetical protein